MESLQIIWISGRTHQIISEFWKKVSWFTQQLFFYNITSFVEEEHDPIRVIHCIYTVIITKIFDFKAEGDSTIILVAFGRD